MTDEPKSADRCRLQLIPSGIAGIDTILRGGFLEGGITIIQGAPGSGKTIFGNQLCFSHAAHGQRALYITLLAESHARMLLHIGALGFFDNTVIPDRLSYVSAFPVLEAEGARGLLTLLRREIRTQKATLLILDGLVAAEKAAGSDMEFKKFIHELQTLATTTNCSMFLLTSGGNDNGEITTAEHTMVDCVIELRSRLYGWRAERDLEIRKRRGEGFLRGRHAFRIDENGIEVFPRFESLRPTPSPTERAQGPRASTGLPPLDVMINGGFPAASNTMLIGPSGSGKTTLGLHFLSQCSQEIPGLFFGFYETAVDIKAKAATFGLPLADLLENGHVLMFRQSATEALLDETCAHLIALVRNHGIKRLFLDGLGGLATVAEDPERIDHVLTALVGELRSLGVTSIFSKASDNLLGSLLDAPGCAFRLPNGSSVADNILLLQISRFRSRTYRTIMAFKVRDSRIDDRLRLFDITDHGLVVDDNPDRVESLMSEAAGQVKTSNSGAASVTSNPRPSRS